MTLRRVLLASAAIHAAVFACILHAKTTSPPPRAGEALSDPTIELAVDPPPTEAVPDPTAMPAPEAVAVAAPRQAAGGRAGVAGARGGGGGPAGAGSATPASEPALAGSNSTWIVDLGGAVVQPFHAQPPGPSGGFGPTRQWQEGLDRAAELPRKDDSLKDALSAQDAAKGLGPDGPVLHALEDETRRSLAPLRGTATFHAIVDATGFVTSLTVTDNSGDLVGWNDARDKALAELQKKKLALRGAKNGASFDIYVESKMRLPAGNESSDFGVRDGMLTMGGDLSNVGSKPSRVVHARLTSFTPL